jgi:ABC-type transport system substrate-binding protein
MELGSKLIELIAQAPQIFERADPDHRRELVGLLTSNRVVKGRTLEFELREPFDTLVSAANSENGWVNWSGLATLLASLATGFTAPLNHLVTAPRPGSTGPYRR